MTKDHPCPVCHKYYKTRQSLLYHVFNAHLPKQQHSIYAPWRPCWCHPHGYMYAISTWESHIANDCDDDLDAHYHECLLGVDIHAENKP